MERVKTSIDDGKITLDDYFNNFELVFDLRYFNRVKKVFEEAKHLNLPARDRDIRFETLVQRIDPELNSRIFSNYIRVGRMQTIYDKLCDSIKPKQYSYEDLYRLPIRDLITIYENEKELAKLLEG